MCHTKRAPQERCVLCGWPVEGYDVIEARENFRNFATVYRPSDRAFAQRRHPILGPSGEYAIDRVALRARAYRELAAFGEAQNDCAQLSERLEHLLACVCHADELYRI